MARFDWYGPGLTMCALCFEPKSKDELWADKDGQKWDVCTECRMAEHAEMMKRGMDDPDF